MDTIWDLVHTVIRPVGGALIAVTALGEASPGVTAAAALLGGAVATSSHLTKASTRVVANTSPEPFSNWALSLAEDAFVVGLGYLALTYPLVALGVALVVLVAILTFSVVIVRTAVRWMGRRQAPVELAARGASPAAFDGRCILAGGVAPPSNMPDILGRRALPAGRLARLGATRDLHHGLLVVCATLNGHVAWGDHARPPLRRRHLSSSPAVPCRSRRRSVLSRPHPGHDRRTDLFASQDGRPIADLTAR